MERVTCRIPKKHVEEAEKLAEDGEYANRSEVIRTGLRDLLKEERKQRRQQRSTSWGKR